MNTLHRQQGFTLVEVITVMLVLVAIASITVESSKDFVFQNRYEITKDRYEKIRKAIIGDANQVINGQPNIEGFVKDVGRLPFALQELLVEGYCSDTRYFTQATCIAPNIWTANGYGWKKPYISSSNNLKDGWGNTSDGNYGWEVSFLKDSLSNATTTITEAVSMNIQSKGKNGCITGETNCTDLDTYDGDYPSSNVLPSIKQSDWMVNLDSIKISVMAKMAISPIASCNITFSDPATCTTAGGTWFTLPPTTQATCESGYGTWNSGICSITGAYCSEAIKPKSKLGCESLGGIWDYGTPPPNICMKITRNVDNYLTDDILPTIQEDGRVHYFSTLTSLMYFDADRDGIKSGTTEITTTKIPMGEVIIAIYTPACPKVPAASPPETLYNSGTEIKTNVYPNTTLPTINW